MKHPLHSLIIHQPCTMALKPSGLCGARLAFDPNPSLLKRIDRPQFIVFIV
jgi:hypothetical protein